jgi:DNA-binding Lrp family transcriptional regulator
LNIDVTSKKRSSTRSRTLVGEVVDVLTSWGPRDFIGAFQRFHAGSISLIHLNVLILLEGTGPLPMSRLAEALDVSVASATGIVDRMAKRGLVERRHSEADRRLVALVPERVDPALGHEEEVVVARLGPSRAVEERHPARQDVERLREGAVEVRVGPGRARRHLPAEEAVSALGHRPGRDEVRHRPGRELDPARLGRADASGVPLAVLTLVRHARSRSVP